MSRPKRSEAEQQWRRDRIVVAAAQVFERVGLAAATIEEIAREAEYSPAALYNYFRGKDDLFLAVMERVGTLLYKALEDPLPDGLAFEEIFRWRARRAAETALANRGILMSFHTSFPEYEMRAMQGCGTHPPPFVQRADQLWAHLMAAGQAAGALRPDVTPERLMRMWLGMLRATLAPEIGQHTPETLLASTDLLVDLFMNGAKGANRK